MSSIENFEQMLECLESEPSSSFYVMSEVLQDAKINHKQLAETAKRNIRRKNLIVRGQDGKPSHVIEFEFLPKGENK